MLARVVFHPQSDGLTGLGLVDVLVLVLHGLHWLGEIRGMTFQAHRVAFFQRAFVDLDNGYAKMAVIMGHGADGLFMLGRLFHRRDAQRRRAGFNVERF